VMSTGPAQCRQTSKPVFGSIRNSETASAFMKRAMRVTARRSVRFRSSDWVSAWLSSARNASARRSGESCGSGRAAFTSPCVHGGGAYGAATA
jgi:transglutaminase-like putative cysteine protease